MAEIDPFAFADALSVAGILFWALRNERERTKGLQLRIDSMQEARVKEAEKRAETTERLMTTGVKRLEGKMDTVMSLVRERLYTPKRVPKIKEKKVARNDDPRSSGQRGGNESRTGSRGR